MCFPGELGLASPTYPLAITFITLIGPLDSSAFVLLAYPVLLISSIQPHIGTTSLNGLMLPFVPFNQNILRCHGCGPCGIDDICFYLGARPVC